MPTREVWTEGIFDPIIQQITYYNKIQKFNRNEDAIALFDELEKMLEQLMSFCLKQQKTISVGLQSFESELEVFCTEIHDGTDVLLFSQKNHHFSFIKYDGGRKFSDNTGGRPFGV